VFQLVLEATHARFINPLRPLMALWDKKVRGCNGCREVGFEGWRVCVAVRTDTDSPSHTLNQPTNQPTTGA